ncbi:uncharacterized protein A1O9_07382 [Exophiala aquamarina CBS 119918]|uniref:Major facilitator superfamily (MFS) profile domain-containing protein n=1 Tax=Exophiala aquamarina CBS 119918 TaxID=1182545 RepID=A0A072PBQ2_9EURO|nr:uncharacterized protein A1O9_07382 [Exophiala aquamarina CBS 119918]KEF57192.1 hypothetical protein A1O9_07382 [Exophiala aquamarina CBS 119918]
MHPSHEDVKAAAKHIPVVDGEKVGTVDSALTFLHSATVTMTSTEEEKRLVRKVDWMIMPLLSAVYLMQFIDKNLINFANIMGLGKDTHTSPAQFSHLALSFWVSYLAFEPLSGYLLQKLPVAKYLGFNVVLWGICVTFNCVCKNYASLVALRVLLGVFESCVSPAMILVTCMWYKRREQPLRVGIWCGTVGLGIIIGALCSFGFQHYVGRSFKSWQIMFLLFGLVTIVLGLLVVVFLPDNPMSSKLSDQEKVLAIERLRGDTTGVENKNFKPSQMFEALKDPHTWLICVITTAINIPNAAVSTFQAGIILSLGFTPKEAALLNIPSGVIGIIAMLSACYISYRYSNRSFVIVSLLVPGIIGASLMAFLPISSKIGRLFGTYLTNTIPSSTPLIYSWVAANVAGHTKKVTMNALLLMAFCLGNILGPLTFTNPPDYISAKITIIAVLGLAILLIFVLASIYHRENSRRAERGDLGQGMCDSSFLDLTDRQNKEFKVRYDKLNSSYETHDIVTPVHMVAKLVQAVVS